MQVQALFRGGDAAWKVACDIAKMARSHAQLLIAADSSNPTYGKMMCLLKNDFLSEAAAMAIARAASEQGLTTDAQKGRLLWLLVPNDVRDADAGRKRVSKLKSKRPNKLSTSNRWVDEQKRPGALVTHVSMV
jgi:hypothetical protein